VAQDDKNMAVTANNSVERIKEKDTVYRSIIH
jgi:hypothetical protein